MKHIYYKNDFAVEIKLQDAEGNQIAPPEWEWSIEFSDGRKKYICSLDKGNANVVGDTIVCYLDSHKFACGEISYKFVQAIPDLNYLDGYQDLQTPVVLPLELWEKASDDADPIESSVVPAYVVYDAYMTAKAQGYQGTAEEYYKLLLEVGGYGDAEAERVANEKQRVANEVSRQSNFDALKAEATTAINETKEATDNALNASELASEVTKQAKVATSDARTATDKALASASTADSATAGANSATAKATAIAEDLEAKKEADYWRGEKGVKGDKGDDGISPSVETSKSGDTSTITITDAKGTHTVEVVDGKSVDAYTKAESDERYAVKATEDKVTTLQKSVNEMNADLGGRIGYAEDAIVQVGNDVKNLRSDTVSALEKKTDLEQYNAFKQTATDKFDELDKTLEGKADLTNSEQVITAGGVDAVGVVRAQQGIYLKAEPTSKSQTKFEALDNGLGFEAHSTNENGEDTSGYLMFNYPETDSALAITTANIEQSTGNSENFPMSQKAVTDALSTKQDTLTAGVGIQIADNVVSAKELPRIEVTPSPVIKLFSGAALSPIDMLKVSNYEEYVKQGFEPILLRKINYSNCIYENSNRMKSYSKYGWRWRKESCRNESGGTTMIFDKLSINSNGLLCNEKYNDIEISSIDLVDYEVVDKWHVIIRKGRRAKHIIPKVAKDVSCRVKYGLVFVDFRGKNISSYKFEEKDFISNVACFDVLVNIRCIEKNGQIIVDDVITQIVCAK